MSLALGSRVGPYEIVALIGAGGMGEVYRARDHRLGRDVAIKVLAPAFSTDPGRLARFEREARILAALNHPNIATIHGLEESAGVRALVMELVEGETLSARLASSARGGSRPLRTAEAIEIARQIAAALDAAHAKGIVHRDLKPDNVMITPAGTVKVLDFGIGKIREPEVANPDGPTATSETGFGVLGTPAYMSPEQARGLPVDKRTDVWAFGCVLYQLLTGRRPFEGATVADTLSAVLEQEPDWNRLPADLPATIRRLLQRCLQKDPHQRLRDIGDIWIQLEDALAASEPAPQAAPPRRRRTGAIAAAAALGLLAAGGFVAVRYLGLGRTTPPTGLQYTQLTSFADAAVQPSLSSDGRMLTYIRGDSTFMARGQVYVQLLPGGEPVQLTNDDWQKMSPVFSPDGTQIAYTVDNWDTMSVPVLGGPARTLLVNASGLTWLPGTSSPPRVLYSEVTGESFVHMVISTATEGGLERRRIYAPSSIYGMAHRSALSPDGRWVLVVEMLTAWLPCRVVPFDGSGTVREVGPPGAPCTDAAWSPDGRWIYVSANTGDGFHIWRQRFPDGAPEPVTFGATEEQGIAFFPDGKSFVTSVGTDINTVWLHDARGDRQITSQGYAYLPALSPDGARLYYLLRAGASTTTWVKGELWVTELSTGHRQRLLPDFHVVDYGISPDGASVAFGVAETDALWVAAVDGRTPPRRLSDGLLMGRAVFGPRGDIYFVKVDPDGGFLYRVNADGTGLRKALERPADVILVYDISPDGKWAAVWAGRSVIVAPLDGGEPITFCSECGTIGAEHRGVTPVVMRWSRDGRFLYVHAAWTTRATYAIPLEPGQVVPPLPAGGVTSADDLATVPGAIRLPELRAFPTDDPSTYVFMRATPRRNIYRISVP